MRRNPIEAKICANRVANIDIESYNPSSPSLWLLEIKPKLFSHRLIMLATTQNRTIMIHNQTSRLITSDNQHSYQSKSVTISTQSNRLRLRFATCSRKRWENLLEENCFGTASAIPAKWVSINLMQWIFTFYLSDKSSRFKAPADESEWVMCRIGLHRVEIVEKFNFIPAHGLNCRASSRPLSANKSRETSDEREKRERNWFNPSKCSFVFAGGGEKLVGEMFFSLLLDNLGGIVIPLTNSPSK